MRLIWLWHHWPLTLPCYSLLRRDLRPSSRPSARWWRFSTTCSRRWWPDSSSPSSPGSGRSRPSSCCPSQTRCGSARLLFSLWCCVFPDLSVGPRGLTFTWWGCRSVCFRHKPTEPAHSFVFCSCVYFCLYGLFNRISFHKFSWQLSASSLCSSGLISAVLVLLTTYLYESLLQPQYNPLWLTGFKAPTN